MTHQALADLFRSKHSSEPEILAIAPGRVNLIGEHTDYNDGFVFPVAIDKEVLVASMKTDTQTTLFSEQTGDGASFDASSISPGQVSGWAAYAAGMAWVLREHTGQHMPNLQAVVSSTVPMGSGVSSSAAIEMAFGVTWNQAASLGIDNKTMAKLAQRCENEFVGVNCGIMDQMASAMGKADHAMFLDTRSLEIQYAPIPDDLLIVICDTKKPRALTDSAYNERRSQCEEAAQTFGVKTLRDANQADLETHAGEMPEIVWKRARHVITENERSLKFRIALQSGDKTEIGALMKASHMSLRDDYEVSCTELDAMAESCWDQMECVGARMTGAGFGGACVALVEKKGIDAFIEGATLAYRQKTGIVGSLMVCQAVDGARCF